LAVKRPAGVPAAGYRAETLRVLLSEGLAVTPASPALPTRPYHLGKRTT